MSFNTDIEDGILMLSNFDVSLKKRDKLIMAFYINNEEIIKYNIDLKNLKNNKVKIPIGPQFIKIYLSNTSSDQTQEINNGIISYNTLICAKPVLMRSFRDSIEIDAQDFFLEEYKLSQNVYLTVTDHNNNIIDLNDIYINYKNLI